MPNKKSDAQLRGERTATDPNPNTLPKGRVDNNFQVVTPGAVPKAGQPRPVAQMAGERLAPATPWAKHRPKATGHRK